MKATIFNTKNKGILFLVVLSVISTGGFSQNKMTVIFSSINYHFALPVICVLCLAIFLFTAFLKQKNH